MNTTTQTASLEKLNVVAAVCCCCTTLYFVATNLLF
jgi:hypothetical protein